MEMPSAGFPYDVEKRGCHAQDLTLYAGDSPKREAQGLQKEDPQEAVRPGGTKERPPRRPTEAESLLVGNQFLRNCKIARRRSIYSWKLILLNSTSTFFDSF